MVRQRGWGEGPNLRGESGEGGRGAGNALSSQQTVHSLESLENRVFVASRGISKCFLFCFVALWPGAWKSLYSTRALQETCCLG